MGEVEGGEGDTRLVAPLLCLRRWIQLSSVRTKRKSLLSSGALQFVFVGFDGGTG